jgi:hypothetical protein
MEGLTLGQSLDAAGATVDLPGVLALLVSGRAIVEVTA